MATDIAPHLGEALTLSTAQLGLIAELAEGSPQWGWERPPLGPDAPAVLLSGLRARGIVVEDSLAEPLRPLIGVALHARAAVTASVMPDGLIARAWAVDAQVAVAVQVDAPLVHLMPVEPAAIAPQVESWVLDDVAGQDAEWWVELRLASAESEFLAVVLDRDATGARLGARTGDGPAREIRCHTVEEAAAALAERVGTFVERVQ